MQEAFHRYWMIIGFLTFFSDARKTHFSLYMWSAGELALSFDALRSLLIFELDFSVSPRRFWCSMYAICYRLRLACFSGDLNGNLHNLGHLLDIPSSLHIALVAFRRAPSS